MIAHYPPLSPADLAATRNALRACSGNISAASRALGIDEKATRERVRMHPEAWPKGVARRGRGAPKGTRQAPATARGIALRMLLRGEPLAAVTAATGVSRCAVTAMARDYGVSSPVTAARRPLVLFVNGVPGEHFATGRQSLAPVAARAVSAAMPDAAVALARVGLLDSLRRFEAGREVTT